MKRLFLFLFLAVLLSCASQKPKTNSSESLEIMFYNLENFFDTIDDPQTADEEYLPSSIKQWNTNKYQTKLKNISKVISAINDEDIPDLIGLCEFEHRSILNDIRTCLGLKNYKISHFESPDFRGIDVGLIYNDSIFDLISEDPIYVQIQTHDNRLGNMNQAQKVSDLIKKENGNTRNILKTRLRSGSDTLVIYTCHFPSRRGGKKETSYKREQVAYILKNDIKQEIKKSKGPRIVVMGDFNDEPLDPSISQVLRAKSPGDETALLYNLFYQLDLENEGSYRYRSHMNMLDQIIISPNLWNRETQSRIFNPSWLIQTGKYAGFPLRTFGGKNYLAGYSDHFPVFAQIPTK